MGFSSSLALLLMAVFLTRASAAPLKVANYLTNGPLTVLNPPGCCSLCPPDDPTINCPAVCVPCRNVTVAEHSVGSLDTHTLYPMPYMMIQVHDVVWCVRSGDLALLRETITLSVGPGVCGPDNAGLQAFAFAIRGERSSRGDQLCLNACSPLYVMGARQK